MVLRDWSCTVFNSKLVEYKNKKLKRRIEITKITGDFAGAVNPYWNFRVISNFHGIETYSNDDDFSTKNEAITHAIKYMKEAK